MKKTILLILITIALAIPISATMGYAFSSSNYLAQVQIDTQLRPGYAPEAPAAAKNSKTGGVANYILQLMAGSLIYLAGPTAILILATGGLRYVTSRGNQPEMDKAKKTITGAIIGLVVIIISLAIVANIIRMIGELPSNTTSSSNASNPNNAPNGNITP